MTLKTSQPSTPQVDGPLLEIAATILIICAGYKPAAGKSVDEYQKLDAGDESLARWKASLGLGSATSAENSGPKVALYIVDLFFAFIYFSPSLPS
jgi:Rho GDP-dissociation inhibitor